MSSGIWTDADRRGLKTPALRSANESSVGDRSANESSVGRGLQTPPSDPVKSSFRPWHFFLLASLMAATVAVLVSRQSTPGHLILMSVTIVAAGLVAAGFYRALAPLAAEDVTMFSEPLSERGRAATEREKRLVMRSIKELEFDRAMGKISQKDFDEMAGRLRSRAIALMKQLDEGGPGYREAIERELEVRLKASPTAAVRLKPDTIANIRLKPDATTSHRTCAGCGAAADTDAAFCKRCGAKL